LSRNSIPARENIPVEIDDRGNPVNAEISSNQNEQPIFVSNYSLTFIRETACVMVGSNKTREEVESVIGNLLRARANRSFTNSELRIGTILLADNAFDRCR
jgi:hypothetical protein